MKNTQRMYEVLRHFEDFLKPITTFLSSLVCVIMCINCLYNRYVWEFTYKIITSIHSAL